MKDVPKFPLDKRDQTSIEWPAIISGSLMAITFICLFGYLGFYRAEHKLNSGDVVYIKPDSIRVIIMSVHPYVPNRYHVRYTDSLKQVHSLSVDGFEIYGYEHR